MATQTLTTGQLISIGRGYLSCEVGEIYTALNGLLDDDLMTHQLPRAVDHVGPRLAEEFPWLEDLDTPDLSEVPADQKKDVVMSWVDSVSDERGSSHTVVDLSDGWAVRNPLDEALDYFEPHQIIPVVK